MIKQYFALYPFAATADVSSVTATVDILRSSSMLAVNCEFHGSLDGILIPCTAESRYRKDKLWEQTCFEVFLAVRNSPSYWEFNFSPAGHWNVYSFEAYRKEMKEEAAFSELPFSVHYEEGHALSCSVEIDLNKIVRADSRLEAAVNSVMKLRDGTLTYWASTHNDGRPDFHRRDSFIIDL
ncbi:MAG: DOMON-like domain-containing protein [Nitrospirae bacterium]|nr:DOMON-like domain-containing protein [Nitrospirota bacterium]